MEEVTRAFDRLRRAIRQAIIEWMVGKIIDMEGEEWSPECAVAFHAWFSRRPPIEGAR